MLIRLRLDKVKVHEVTIIEKDEFRDTETLKLKNSKYDGAIHIHLKYVHLQYRRQGVLNFIEYKDRK